MELSSLGCLVPPTERGCIQPAECSSSPFPAINSWAKQSLTLSKLRPNIKWLRSKFAFHNILLILKRIFAEYTG